MIESTAKATFSTPYELLGVIRRESQGVLGDLQSLDFTVNRFFMKLFCTVCTCCQQMFHVELPSDIIKKRSVKFESKCDILSVS